MPVFLGIKNGMNFRKMYDFLRELNKEGNNNKAWMDENRARYHEVRDELIHFFDEVDLELQKIDPDYQPTGGRKAISRINNNKVFKPDAPTYKDTLGFTLDKRKEGADFYIHLGLKENFIAGGCYHPPSEALKNIRQEIDYNGEEFKAILSDQQFDQHFELLREEALKKAPQGYEQDHPMIDLLRLKNFAVMHPITQEDVMDSSFKDLVIESYEVMLPFRRFLDKALGVEVG